MPNRHWRRIVERRREGSRAPSPASRAPTGPSRSSRNPKSPPAASVALVSTTVFDPVEQQLPQHRRQVERHRGERHVCRRACRSARSSAPRRSPAAAGRSVWLSPSDDAPRAAAAPPRSSCSSWQPALGDIRLRQPVGDRLHRVAQPTGSARSAASSSAASPSPRPDRRRTRRPGGSCPPGASVEQAVAAARTAASAARRASASAGSSRSRSRSRLARLSRSSDARQLVDERGHQAAAVPLEPAQQPPHAAAGHLGAEVRGRDVLEVMRLVEDQPLVGRQHRRLLPVVLACRTRGRRRAGGGSPPRRRPRPPGAAPGTGSSGRSAGTGAGCRGRTRRSPRPRPRGSAATGRSLSVPSAVRPAHSARPTQLVAACPARAACAARRRACCSRARQR